MLIVTNIRNFPTCWRARTGEEGRSVYASGWRDFVRWCAKPDTMFAVDGNPGLVLALAALGVVLPFRRRPLVAIDLILPRPQGFASRCIAFLKCQLLRRVDHFIHYFTDLRGYEEVYGIGPQRSSFVPFKPNLRYRVDPAAQTEGDYVLCFGRSRRDYDTFFAAMEKLPYPGAIPEPDWKALASHGSNFTDPGRIPSNVRVLEDDRSLQTEARLLAGARLVVIPIRKSEIAPSGTSTALNAMLFGKCVIASDVPGLSDVFQGMLLTVPPGDPGALASMIMRAWNDDDLRRTTAESGRQYALSVGGEPELYQRIIDQIALWLRPQAASRLR